MAPVVLTIAGRTYRMACDDGEEAQLEELARIVENKILTLRESFGDIGEQRIVVMAAITIADEIAGARKKIAALERDLAGLRAEVEARHQQEAALEDRVAKALDAASRRVENLARELTRADAEPDGLPK
jgi:cell division protein ZapA